MKRSFENPVPHKGDGNPKITSSLHKKRVLRIVKRFKVSCSTGGPRVDNFERSGKMENQYIILFEGLFDENREDNWNKFVDVMVGVFRRMKADAGQEENRSDQEIACSYLDYLVVKGIIKKKDNAYILPVDVEELIKNIFKHQVGEFYAS
jgi:hypothetical protein